MLYSRGMYAALVISEAIRKAQELAGTSAINAAAVRDGFEALEITEARMAELGLPGLRPAFRGVLRGSRWSRCGHDPAMGCDGEEVEPDHRLHRADDEVLTPLVMEDSAAFAAENNIAERCN